MAAFDRIATLDKVPLLSSLGKSQKHQLAKELIVKVYRKGDDVMVEGEEGDFFLIIIDGKLDVSSSAGGHLAYLSDGDYAGEQALLKATTRNASLTAVENTTCLLCSKHTFDKIKKSVKFANRYPLHCSLYKPTPALTALCEFAVLCPLRKVLSLSVHFVGAQRGQKAPSICNQYKERGENA